MSVSPEAWQDAPDGLWKDEGEVTKPELVAAERAASAALRDAFDRWYDNPTPENRAAYEQAREAHVTAFNAARFPDA